MSVLGAATVVLASGSDPSVDASDPQPASLASDLHPGFMAAFFVIAAAALVLNALMTASVLRSRILRTPEYMLNLNVAASDLLLSLTVVVTAIASLVQGSPLVDSHAACQVVGAVIETSVSVMTITIILIAIHHYLVIIHGRVQLTYAQAAIYIACVWLLSAFSVTLVFMLGGSFVARPAHIHCHFDYTSHEISQRLTMIYLLVVLVSFPILIGILYRLIYAKVVSVEQQVRVHLAPSMVVATNPQQFELDESLPEHQSYPTTPAHLHAPAPVRTRQIELERPQASELPPKIDSQVSSHSIPVVYSADSIQPLVPRSTIDSDSGSLSGPGARQPSSLGSSGHPLKSALREAMRNVANRGFSVALVFMCSWFPSVVAVFYEIATDRHVPWQADGAVTLFASMSIVANPIVFFWVDLRLRRSLMELLNVSR
nr:hypothetical protein HK105_001970 [Polyrhizophydium stewartii]